TLYQPNNVISHCIVEDSTLDPDCMHTRRIDYSKGRKLCITCNRVIIPGLTDLLRCPCCDMLLRTKPCSVDRTR
ncbi:MAG TPA: hypothetical protein VFJ51_02055, partial [Nitrososphaeraceae archaeon]|nr:hypothetical protein [Nitrososphaeraceae archaeon]